jgi:Cd2+/Zn2+-exporting ATPase
MRPKETALLNEPKRMQFRIRGMDCAEEIAILKRAVGPLVGGEEHLAFDLPGGEGVRDRARALGRAVLAKAREARGDRTAAGKAG